MTTDLYEGFGASTRNDPTTRTKLANDSGVLILNLGDRATTLVVDSETETIQLLNKLVEINKAEFKNLSYDEAVAAGYGVHVAATTDTNRGHTAAKIDVQNDDGSASEELKTLFLIAADGGAVGSDADINLRLGASQTGENAFVEILVDGRWSTDILHVEGPLAFELLTLLGPDLEPLFTDGNDSVDFTNGALGTSPAPVIDFSLFDPESFYDAGDGDDFIQLPTVEIAAEIGFDLTRTVTTGDGRDNVRGSTGDDIVAFGTGLRQTYRDQGGDDVVTFGDALATVRSSGGGNDSFGFLQDTRNVLNYFDERDGVTANLTEGWIEGFFEGEAWRDTFTGSMTDFQATNGDDVVTGWDVDVPGLFANNLFLYNGDDTFIGGDAREVVFLQVSSSGTKTLDGGAGYDFLSWNFITDSLTVNALAGTYSGFGDGTFQNFEEYQLGDGSDVFIGSESRDVVLGRKGNDDIRTNGGDDNVTDASGDSFVDMGSGDDLLFADFGNNTYEGGEGFDSLFLTRSTLSEGIAINLSAGTLVTSLDGEVFNSTVSGFENVRLGIGNDTYVGTDGDDSVRLEFGDNTLTGGAGADTFQFGPSDSRFGDNVITDFDLSEGDKLQTLGGGFTRTSTQVGDDTLLQYFNATTGDALGSVTLENVDAFLFV